MIHLDRFEMARQCVQMLNAIIPERDDADYTIKAYYYLPSVERGDTWIYNPKIIFVAENNVDSSDRRFVFASTFEVKEILESTVAAAAYYRMYLGFEKGNYLRDHLVNIEASVNEYIRDGFSYGFICNQLNVGEEYHNKFFGIYGFKVLPFEKCIMIPDPIEASEKSQVMRLGDLLIEAVGGGFMVFKRLGKTSCESFLEAQSIDGGAVKSVSDQFKIDVQEHLADESSTEAVVELATRGFGVAYAMGVISEQERKQRSALKGEEDKLRAIIKHAGIIDTLAGKLLEPLKSEEEKAEEL